MKRALLISLFSVMLMPVAQAADLCLEGVCIGQDIREVNAQWRPVTLQPQEQVDVRNMLANQPVKQIFDQRNELLVAPEAVLKDLYPFVIRRQIFDGEVLNKLKGVQAFCTSTTLTGELKYQGDGRVFVTFRAMPDESGNAQLRVISIEKQFDIMAFSLRPQDRDKDKAKRKELKAQYPEMVETRDLDTARPNSAEVSFASTLLGYRFLSDVSIPLTLRMRDTADLQMMEDVAGNNVLCKQTYGL